MSRIHVEITGVRTPAAVENNYGDIVGTVLPITGNAYHGFEVVLPDGTKRDLLHYWYKKTTLAKEEKDNVIS